MMQLSGSKIQDSHLGWNVPDFCKESVDFALELSKQVQRLVMVDFPRALPTQSLTWPQIELIIYCLNLSITNR